MRKIFLVFLLLLLTMPFMSIVTNSRTVEKPRKGLYCAFDTQMNMRYLQVFIDSDTTMCIGSRGTHMYAVATWKQYGDTIFPKDSIGYENIDGKFGTTTKRPWTPSPCPAPCSPNITATTPGSRRTPSSRPAARPCC